LASYRSLLDGRDCTKSSTFQCHLVPKKKVIFVLSAQNNCFLLAHENEFLVKTGQVETSNSFECANKINHLSHEIQTLFFLQRYKKNLIFEGKLDEENQNIKYCDTSL
jgi:hypothetical protein